MLFGNLIVIRWIGFDFFNSFFCELSLIGPECLYRMGFSARVFCSYDSFRWGTWYIDGLIPWGT